MNKKTQTGCGAGFAVNAVLTANTDKFELSNLRRLRALTVKAWNTRVPVNLPPRTVIVDAEVVDG